MKEHLLTLFLAVTTAITLFIFHNIGRAESIPVFNANEILFEHPTIHGNITITSNAYDELTLSFLTRNVTGFEQVGYTHAINTALEDTYFLSLPATEDIPFTIHALVSSHPELHQIIVTESNSRIAHGTHAKKTTCEAFTAVFLVASSDLTGENVFILGLDQADAILLEIEIPQQ